MAGIDANTKLLLQMNGDRSFSQHLTTFNQDVILDTTQKKFGYSSVLLSGAQTCYLTVPDHADWALGTSDFTIDLWIRADSFPAACNYIIGTGDWGNGSNGWGVWTQSGNLYFKAMYPGSLPWSVDYSIVHGFVVDTWYHIALTKSSGNYQFYKDGVPIGSPYSNGTSISSTNDLHIGQCPVYLGANSTFNGYMDEIRISDNVRWSADFSASLPTEEYTSDANTLYLNHFEGNISDYPEDTIFNGTVGITATESKFHGSINFSGDDYLTIAGYAQTFTGDLTVEFWENTVMAGNTIPHFFSNYYTPYANGIYCHLATGGVMTFFACSGSGSTLLYLDNQGTTVNDGLWHHIAWVRSGMGSDNCTLYIDGNAVHTGTLTGTITFSYDFQIGSQQGYAPSRNLTGYMDEFRVSDTARWTEDFDVPTDPYSRFNYAISGETTENGKLVLVDDASHILIDTVDITAPTYSRAVENITHTVYLVPTDTGKNSVIYRGVTPAIE